MDERYEQQAKNHSDEQSVEVADYSIAHTSSLGRRWNTVRLNASVMIAHASGCAV